MFCVDCFGACKLKGGELSEDFYIHHSAFIIKKRGTLLSSDDYESRNQMVPASLLAAGVFDKPFLLEFKEAAIHGGLRIGGVENEFRGAATGMLFDVVEYSIELFLRWNRLAFSALFFFAIRLYVFLFPNISMQILVDGSSNLRGSFGVQFERERRSRRRHRLQGHSLFIARGDMLERKDNRGGYTDKLFVSKMLLQVFDGTIARVFHAINSVNFRFIPVFLAIKNIVNGYVLAVVLVIANVKHPGVLVNEPHLGIQMLL